MRLSAITESPLTPGPRIVNVQFGPARTPGMVAIMAEYDMGAREVLFDYNPQEIHFDPQELTGLTRKEAKWLKDKKLDEYIGFDQF